MKKLIEAFLPRILAVEIQKLLAKFFPVGLANFLHLQKSGIFRHGFPVRLLAAADIQEKTCAVRSQSQAVFPETDIRQHIFDCIGNGGLVAVSILVLQENPMILRIDLNVSPAVFQRAFFLFLELLMVDQHIADRRVLHLNPIGEEKPGKVLRHSPV